MFKLKNTWNMFESIHCILLKKNIFQSEDFLETYMDYMTEHNSFNDSFINYFVQLLFYTC